MNRLLTFVFVIGISTANAQIYFGTRTNYNLPGSSTFSTISTADYNNDGNVDIVATNSSFNSISVFIATGPATYGAAVTYPTGNSTAGVGSADINSDGNVDVLVANLNSNNISIFLGTGTGTFTAQPPVPTEGGPQGPMFGDINGDGKIDVACANYFSNSVSILLGNGDGTFTTGTAVSTGSNPEAVPYDVDNDGHLDMVALNTGNGNVTVRKGNGDGTFGTGNTYATGGNPRGLAVADFDGDGKLDMIVGNFSGNSISFLKGHGDTSFDPAVNQSMTAPTDIITRDFNADGEMDLAIANSGSNTVGIYTGNGNGSFSLYEFVTVGSSPNFMRLIMTDLNSDGRDDIVTTNDNSPFVGVLLGTTPPGGSGTALSFNGVNQVSQLGTWFNYQNFTISMWVKPGSTQVAFADMLDNNHNATRSISVEQNNTTTNEYIFGPTDPVTFDLIPDVWQHVALVSTSTQKSVYINGVLAGSTANSGITYDGSQSFYLGGAVAGGKNWNGEMDEVRIYSFAQTQSEIASGLCGEISSTTSGLVAYYRMNEGSGNTIYDATTNARNGALLNGPLFTPSTRGTSPATISSFSPASGPVGTLVTINGTNFDLSPANNVVKFNGVQATVASSTTTTLTAYVPGGATTGFITVANFCSPAATSATPFTVIEPPNNLIYYNKADGTIWATSGNNTADQFITNGYWPMVSPDGRYLLFKSGAAAAVINKDIWVRDLILSTESKVFTNTGDIVSYSWNSDASKILFDYSTPIMIMNRDGSGLATLLNVDELDDAPNVSPIDNKIAFYNENIGILVANSNGTGRTAVPNTKPSDLSPIWSPDGQWVAFIRFGTTPNNLYKIRPDGTGLTQLTNLAAGESQMAFSFWTADGTSLVMSGVVNCTSGLFQVPSDGSKVIKRIGTTLTSSPFDNVGGVVGIPPAVLTPSNPIPTITGFTPTVGTVGTAVTITGTDFNTSPLNNIVKFNGVTAVVTASTSTTITTTVPAGTTTGPITVTICTTTATSPSNFCVPPAAPGVIPNFGCLPSSAVVLAATGGSNGDYRWYTASVGGVAISSEVNDNYITPPISSTTTYFVSISNGTCESSRTPVVAEIKSCNPNIQPVSANAPAGGQVSVDLVPLVTTVVGVLDVSSFIIVSQPTSGAKASIKDGVVTIDYTGISFLGEDHFTIRACDNAGNCSEQEIVVDVSGDIKAYNAVSLSRDGKNDVFYLESIDAIPDAKENKVSIFSRWGDVVFEVENYNNTTRAFTGNNKSGSPLPAGTYFYKVEFNSSRKPMTGWILIR